MRRLSMFIKKNVTSILFLTFVLGLFLVTSRYVDYPDEYINLLAGKTILAGGLPYKDFWDHHLPFAWYSGALMLFVTGQSFVKTRLLWALVQFGAFAVLFRWIKKNHPALTKPFMAFFFVYPAMALYYWFHLFLADSLAVLFFSLSFWILLAETFAKTRSVRSLYVSSLLVFCMVMSSATFLYMAVVLYLWHAHLLNWKLNKALFQLVGWSILPYGLFAISLVLTNAWSDFYFANFVYNTKYYISIPNYVRGAHFNPIKFSLTLIANFLDGYLPLLSQIKHLDLYLPAGTLAGLGTLSLIGILFAHDWILGILFFLLVALSAPRSGLQTFHETDYQSAMFLVLGLISAVVSLWKMIETLAKEEWLSDLQRVVRFVLLTFFLFTAIFLTANTFQVGYKIYTQKFPSIHNGGPAAQFIDEILNDGDYYFVGPYEPQESFYVMKGRWTGKHPSLLPQFREGAELRSSFLAQFNAHPPKIVIYKQSASIFQTPALEFGKFFLEWMKGSYTPLEKVKGVEVLKNPTGVDLKADLHIRIDRLAEVLSVLRGKGYIQ